MNQNNSPKRRAGSILSRPTVKRLLLDALGSTSFASLLFYISLHTSNSRISLLCLIGGTALQSILALRTWTTLSRELSEKATLSASDLSREEFDRNLHVATAASIIAALAIAVMFLGFTL